MFSLSQKVLIGGSIIALGIGAYVAVTYQGQPTSQPEEFGVVAVPREKVTPSVVTQIKAATSEEQLEAASDLLEKISRERGQLNDVNELLNYIKQDCPGGISADAWELLMNSTFNAVRRTIDPRSPNDVAETLAHLALESNDPVIRLYAIQHISFWYPKELQHKQLLEDVLREASTRQTDSAGSAIKAISDLQQQGVLSKDFKLQAGDSSSTIDQETLNIVSNKEASAAVRVTATHTLQDRRVMMALPALRLIAQDISEPTMLRKAAIYTIGELGASSDIEVLKQIKGSQRLLMAVTPAVHKLSKNIH